MTWFVMIVALGSHVAPPTCPNQKPNPQTMQFCGNPINENCASAQDQTACQPSMIDRSQVTQDCTASEGNCCDQQVMTCWRKFTCEWNAQTQTCSNVGNPLQTSTTMAKRQGVCCPVCGKCTYPL